MACRDSQELAPDAGPTIDTAVPLPTPAPEPPDAAPPPPEPRCPPDMVKVDPARVQLERPTADAGPPLKAPAALLAWPERAYCVDRFEAILVDHGSSERISPYYAPNKRLAGYALQDWEKRRHEVGSPEAQQIGLPLLPAWQRERDPVPRALARPGVVPNGYVNALEAASACRNADKRLCTRGEWRLACGGEQGWRFPYGEAYEQGKCNVFREAHPAMELHDNPSTGHTDPRLNLVTFKGRPLLRKTGGSLTCASRWGEDAIVDMVGNLDEWIDDPDGSFAGGFYARATKDGCDWLGTAHPPAYADYSTGVRCCADLGWPGGKP